MAADHDASDLFSLGRRATAVRDRLFGPRGFFVRTRQLLPSGAWRGPRDAAESWVEETDLPALGGLGRAVDAGVKLLVGGASAATHAAAHAAGLQSVWRLAFAAGEADAVRLQRIRDLAAWDAPPRAVLPTSEGEAQGLDAVRFFGLARVTLGDVPVHLVADVTRLGPRLAQMALGFGADELFAPIVAERALRLGDNARNPAMTRREAATLLRGAGLIPCERLSGGALEEVTS